MATMVKRRFESLFEAIEASPRLSVWISVNMATMLLGTYAYLASLATSMEILEFSTKIPWAALIATYIFLVAAGSGLCIVNALGAVFGLHRYEILAKRMAFLSLTTILFGMICIVAHLGHPERMPLYNAISPNFRSAISWMGLLYTIYMAVVVLELWLLSRADLAKYAERANGLMKKPLEFLALQKSRNGIVARLLQDPKFIRFIGTLAFITGASALSMLGSVFAHTESRTLWYGAYYPVYFLVSAIFSGLALLLVVTIITYRVRSEKMPPALQELLFEMARMLAIALSAGFLLSSLRLFAGVLDPVTRGPAMLLLIGRFESGFWLFETVIMTALPIFVLMRSVRRSNIRGVLVGSLSVVIGAFVMRYNFVVAGQIYPNAREILSSYLPATLEIFLIGGVIAAFLFTYTIGDMFLSLKEKAE